MLKDEPKPSAGQLLVTYLLICLGSFFAGCQNSQTASSNVPPAANAGVSRTLGSFRPVYGTKYLMAPITSEGKGEYFSSKGNYGNTHNYAFFDTEDELTRTLLPSNDYWITETKRIPEEEDARQPSTPVQWFLYFLVKSDTDGDKKLTPKDNKVLAISDAGGAGYTEIISEVEEVYGQALSGATCLHIIYRSKSKKYVAKIDLPNGKVLSTKELTLQFEDLQ
jgi:hypothetical protein